MNDGVAGRYGRSVVLSVFNFLNASKMRLFFRQFLTTMRRFRLACGLNIVGLSVAFAAFILILMQVRYESTFDRFHRHADRICQAEMLMAEGFVPVVSSEFGRTFGGMGAGIEAYALLIPPFEDTYITVERNGTKVGFVQPVVAAQAAFTDIFTPEMVEGVADALREPGKVLLPASLAQSLFGTEHGVVGRGMTVGGKEYEVGGVYRDFPDNSQIKNRVILPLVFGADGYSWDNANYQMYVLLRPGVDPAQIVEGWKAFPLTNKMDMGMEITANLVRLSDRYYDDRSAAFGTGALTERGNRTTMTLLLSIALLVIGIAAVNFVNFATSLTPLRIKNINTRKVLGSPVGTLRAELIFESVGISLLGFCLALLWVYLLRDTGFNELISGGISFSTYSGVIWLGLGVALGVGILAGIYPAVYTTSFPPALVLKGSFGLSPKGRKLRTALIGFQFVVSLGLIVAAMFMQLQNRYLRGINTGLDYEGIAMARMGGELRGSKAFEERVVQSPLVEEVGYSERPLGLTNLHSQWGRELRGTTILFAADVVSWNLPRMLGVELVDGDYFTETDARREGCYHYLFNESAAREFGLSMQEPLNERGWGGEARLTGIARDFNYGSLHAAVGPMAMVLVGKESGLDNRLQTAYFKIKGDPYAAVEHIRRAAAEIDPAYPVDLQFFDAAFDALYRKELKVTTLITVFSLLAVVLSLVGVFGLVVFETQYRRKEIGVRKVMGATVAEILAMFNKSFVRLVLICFVVAAPLAWYGVREWLGTFAYRTPVYWWVFAVSLAIVLFITLATVTIQSWRAATANPVEAFKTE